MRRETVLVYLLVFLSGCAGLIYEILWIKRASLGFGSSSLALATVLAVFFTGLGLGSYLFGRMGRSLQNPLLWCAGLEGLLALNGFLNPVFFGWADQVYGQVYRHFDLDSTALLSLRGVLMAILLLPPTLLMGGTLPLFCRQLVRQHSHIARSIGQIYGINTLGATVGCAATGFALLPAYGITAATGVAAAFNLLAGLGFYRLASATHPPPQTATEHASTREDFSWRRYAWVGLVFFMIGAVALANELLWTRFLNNLVRNSVYTYTITLTVVLAGTVLGSLGAAPIVDRAKGPRPLMLWFAILQAASAGLTLVLTHLPVAVWLNLQAFGVLPFILLMLPPAVIAGASFPLANRIVIADPAQAPRHVGGLTALNIFGCVSGSLVTGFLLLPKFGLDAGIYASTGLGLAAALLALVAAARHSGLHAGMTLAGHAYDDKRLTWAGWIFVGGCVALWALMPGLSPTQVPEDLIARAEPLLDFAEGYNSTLAVIRHGGNKTLLVNQAWQGSENKNHQIMAAHIPMIHYPEAKDILVVGLGVGQTASRFLQYGIERLDIVDIEPRLFDFVRQHFPSAWMDDRRVRLIAEDGRGYVKHTERQYDLLSVEVGQLYRPGVDVFYTREFYREAKARLRPDGMIVQFVPLVFLRPAEFASVLKTFLAEFPEAKLWYNTNELVLMGFNGRMRAVNPAGFERVIDKPVIRADLAYSYWGGPDYALNQFPAFLAGFLASGENLRGLAEAEGSAIYTDDWPWLAYRVSDFRVSDLRAVKLARLVQERLSPLDAAVIPGSTTPGQMQKAEEIRRDNTGDLAASNILEQVGDAPTLNPPEPFILRAGEALQWNPRNLRALKLMGAALIQANGDAEAISYLRRAIALDENDGMVNKKLGFALVKTRQASSAVAYLDRALQRLPDDAETLNALAIALVNSDRSSEALLYFRRAATLEPDNQEAQRNLQAAESLLRQRQPDQYSDTHLKQPQP